MPDGQNEGVQSHNFGHITLAMSNCFLPDPKILMSKLKKILTIATVYDIIISIHVKNQKFKAIAVKREIYELL